MDSRQLRALLDRIGAIRRPCDLDLLVFFYRHPRALLSAEQLVTYLGREREEVAKSLDAMLDGGLVTRSQNPAHSARLYVLELDAIPGGALKSVLEFVTSHHGRREVLRLLACGPDRSPSDHAGRRAALRKVA